MRPTESGLAPYTPVKSLWSRSALEGQGISFNWPFPQLFVGKRFSLLCDETKIYRVNPDWSLLYEIEIYKTSNTSVLGTISPGGPWHFVDMQESWVLTNGTSTVIFPSETSMTTGATQKAYVTDSVPITCATYFKGRAVFGGLDFNKFWDSTWKNFWATHIANEAATGISLSRIRDGSSVTMPMEDNFIWYSLIGGGDLLWLFFPTLAQTSVLTSSYGTTRPLLFDLWKRGDQGFMALDGVGKVQNFKILGETLIAYMDNTVVALNNVVDPTPVLGQRVLWQAGISNNSAIAGDNLNHVFVDNGGNLVHIGTNLKPSVLGYKEFLWPYLGSIMAYHVPNPVDDIPGQAPFGQFYFVTEQATFILNARGLFEVGQRLWAVCYINAMTCGISEYFEEGVDEARIGIDVADFGRPGHKQLDLFSVDFEEDISELPDIEPNLSLAVDYKTSQRSKFSTTEYRLINHQGVVYFPITSNEFKFRLKIDDYTKLKRISSFTPTIKFVDKRFRHSTDLSSTDF